MNITSLFIRRPIMTTLVMVAILFFGIVAYRKLPVSDLPNVDFPTISVTAVLPGASPATMAATVATPLEKQFSTIAGVDNMTSTSSLGQTQIVIQFSLDRNIDAAAHDVQASGQLQNADEFRDLIVAYRNGAPVHLNEIGRVTDDVQNNKTASWYGSSRSIVLAIQRQPGTNTVAVADRVKAALTKVQGDIPPAVNVSVLFDRSTTIQESVHDVTFTLEITLVLVVLVIFIFLRNLSATVIPSLALPMSIIGTFSVMYLLGYSLDNLSLMALTLAVGFVVDDAVVMPENIVRHLEMGKPRMQAALDGRAEIGFTILSMPISLAAVCI